MKPIKINEKGIVFDNGTQITDYHNQECCESVYADWKQIEELFRNSEFDDIKIEGVKGSGFRLNGFFVPCYNIQTGYYDSDLKLVIEKIDGTKKEVDISEFTETQIN